MVENNCNFICAKTKLEKKWLTIIAYLPVQLTTPKGKVPASELKKKTSFQTKHGLVVNDAIYNIHWTSY